jgi:hypothetical protein
VSDARAILRIAAATKDDIARGDLMRRSIRDAHSRMAAVIVFGGDMYDELEHEAGLIATVGAEAARTAAEACKALRHAATAPNLTPESRAALRGTAAAIEKVAGGASVPEAAAGVSLQVVAIQRDKS